MKKYRWFLLRSNVSLLQMARKLRATPLLAEQSYGFLAYPKNDRDRFSFRHLTRSSIRIQVIGEDGQAQEQDIETIDAVAFEIFETELGIWLCVENPPRSLRDLLTNIELVLGWGLSVSPVAFSLDQQRRALKKSDTIRMVAFKGLGSSPKHKALARFEVASKEGVEPEKLDFLNGLDFKVEQATYEVVKDMLKGQISFAPTGLVRITGSLAPYLFGTVESQLSAAAGGADS